MEVDTIFDLNDRVWVIEHRLVDEKCPSCGIVSNDFKWIVRGRCEISGFEFQDKMCKCIRYCFYGNSCWYEEQQCFQTKAKAQSSCNKRNEEANKG